MHWKSGRHTKARHAGNSTHANPQGRPSLSRPTLRRHAIVQRMRQFGTSHRIVIFFFPQSYQTRCASYVAYVLRASSDFVAQFRHLRTQHARSLQFSLFRRKSHSRALPLSLSLSRARFLSHVHLTVCVCVCVCVLQQR